MESDREVTSPRSSLPSSRSLLESLGSELMGILTPVSACMLLVVLLVRALFTGNQFASPSIATVVYAENPSDSTTEKLEGALLNAIVFVAFVTAGTFLLVGLFYFRCNRCLKVYLTFSVFNVLVYLGGALAIMLVQAFSIPIDIITFSILLFNFGVVGVLVVFPVMPVPIIFTQGYLVIIGMLVAFWFTFLPEWTTWVLLLAMAAYDIVAVLLPGGPLNLLLELSMKREEALPALVYESRPPVTLNSAPTQQQQMGRWRRRRTTSTPPASSQSFFSRIFRLPGSNATSYQNLDSTAAAPPPQAALEVASETNVDSISRANDDEETSQNQQTERNNSDMQQGGENLPRHGNGEEESESVPLMSRHIERRMQSLSALIGNEQRAGEAMHDDLVSDLQASSPGTDPEVGRFESTTEGGIKLGLGDFIFYSLLVGRAAMFDLMTVWACYLAIVAGLGATLVLLAVWMRALPALPISISLGVLFYFLTRLILEPFVFQLDTHLIFF